MKTFNWKEKVQKENPNWKPDNRRHYQCTSSAYEWKVPLEQNKHCE